MLNIDANEPLAVAVIEAIRSGDVDGLNRLLGAHPGLATGRIGQRTLLHVAADWPGRFPKGAAVVTALIAAGSDPNAPGMGRWPETPLHWAASSDDVEVLDALIDGGLTSSGCAGRGPGRLKKTDLSRTGNTTVTAARGIDVETTWPPPGRPAAACGKRIGGGPGFDTSHDRDD